MAVQKNTVKFLPVKYFRLNIIGEIRNIGFANLAMKVSIGCMEVIVTIFVLRGMLCKYVVHFAHTHQGHHHGSKQHSKKLFE